MSRPAPYSPDYFKDADKGVLSLRRLAEAGREYTERLEAENEGRRKIVLGVDMDAGQLEYENIDGAVKDSDLPKQRSVCLPFLTMSQHY